MAITTRSMLLILLNICRSIDPLDGNANGESIRREMNGEYHRLSDVKFDDNSAEDQNEESPPNEFQYSDDEDDIENEHRVPLNGERPPNEFQYPVDEENIENEPVPFDETGEDSSSSIEVIPFDENEPAPFDENQDDSSGYGSASLEEDSSDDSDYAVIRRIF